MKEVVIEPNWANVTEWMAQALAEHSFDKSSYGVVGSFMEAIRYLAIKDPETLNQIIKRFHGKGDT